MKVKHLILRLQECDPEAMVVVDGYEGGVDELNNLQDSVEIALDVNDVRWYGTHELTRIFGPDRFEDHKKINVVYLSRT